VYREGPGSWNIRRDEKTASALQEREDRINRDAPGYEKTEKGLVLFSKRGFLGQPPARKSPRAMQRCKRNDPKERDSWRIEKHQKEGKSMSKEGAELF